LTTFSSIFSWKNKKKRIKTIQVNHPIDVPIVSPISPCTSRQFFA
jgi:hypothetical protein